MHNDLSKSENDLENKSHVNVSVTQERRPNDKSCLHAQKGAVLFFLYIVTIQITQPH